MELLYVLLVISLPIALLSLSIPVPWQDSVMEYNRSEQVNHTEFLPKVVYLRAYQGYFRNLDVDKEDQKIEDLFNKPKRDSDDFLNDVLDELISKVDELLGQLEEPKTEARKEGVNISDCVDDAEKRIEQIKDREVANLKECVQDELDKVDNFIIDMWSDINRTYDEVEVETANMDKCRSLAHGPKIYCLAQQTNKIDDLLDELPGKITKASAKITEYVLHFRAYILPKCEHPVLIAATTCGETLLNKVDNCLKVNHPKIKLGRSLNGCSPGACYSIKLVVTIILFFISL